MIALKGTAHASGAIEFHRRDNPWAFQRMDEELKEGQEKRIVFKPEVAPIEIGVSQNSKEEDMPWLERTRSLLNTANTVYLARAEHILRFRQAVHETGVNQKLVVLGSQAEVDMFAHEYWRRITYFYASKHDGFRFDINSMTFREADAQQQSTKIEVAGRMIGGDAETLPRVTFDATGSVASVDIVGWRSSVKEGESGKFAPEESHIAVSVANIKQPLIFCHDYRTTLKSHTFIFEGEKMDERLKKILKKKRPVSR